MSRFDCARCDLDFRFSRETRNAGRIRDAEEHQMFFVQKSLTRRILPIGIYFFIWMGKDTSNDILQRISNSNRNQYSAV